MRTWRPASVTFSNAPTMAQALSGAVGSELPRMDQGPPDKETRVTDREDQLAEQLPEDLDPHEMADSVEDELVAEEGLELGLDPDLALFAARDELEEGEEPLG
jgi:hypothetical protein